MPTLRERVVSWPPHAQDQCRDGGTLNPAAEGRGTPFAALSLGVSLGPGSVSPPSAAGEFQCGDRSRYDTS